ncbi:MAG: helix-hairpin-helix domain-containing protein [Chitinophagales bacterium]
MLSNKEVSRLFKTLCGLMELHGENDFKTRTYANAAFQIGRIHNNVLTMDAAELEKQPGLGKSVVGKIIELKTTGTMVALKELIEVTPPGLIEILNIKGLGGKKVGMIWRDLGIETVGELLYACNENRLAKLKGFGEKTQQSVITSIEYYQSNMGKFHYAAVEKEANDMIDLISSLLKGDKISTTGAIRRKCNVIEKLEMICSDKYAITAKINDLEHLVVDTNTRDKIAGETNNGLLFEINIVPDENYFFELFKQTGSEGHVKYVLEKLNGRTDFDSEEEIYTAAALPFVEPGLREDYFEPGLLNGSPLIAQSDIKGIVHNHSTWSDGKNTIEQMAIACKNGGYEYFVISDHSKTAVYAGGLTELQIADQHKEVDRLNSNLNGFKIFKSIESDILFDGRLDYDDQILKSFDLVIASIHQGLKMDENKATQRLLAVIENPYTTILGHMTGRLILSRPGYPVDHKKIIEACASNEVIIEINANPYRLDMDHAWIPYALSKNVMISINPDAHSVEGINDIHWGVISARKGGLKKNMCWNALSLPEIEEWLAARKKKKGIS